MTGIIPKNSHLDIERWAEWAHLIESELNVEVIAFYPGLTIRVDAVTFEIPEWLALRIINALEFVRVEEVIEP